MSTIIDHLIIELELDPKQFDAGRKKAAEAFLLLTHTADDAAKKTVSPLEKMGQGFEKAAGKAVAFFAAFLGTKFLAQTATELTKASLSIGQLSRTTGESIKTLSLWQGAAERAGGSSQGIMNAILGIDRELKNFAIGRGAPNLMAVIKALNEVGAGINVMDDTGKAKSATQLLLDIADALDRINLPRDNAVGLLRSLGLDEPTVTMMLKGGAAIRKMLDEQKEISIVTEKDVEAANKLTAAWYRMEQAAEQLARSLLTKLEPALTKTLNAFTANNKDVDERRKGVVAGQNSQGGEYMFGGGAGAGGAAKSGGGAPPPPTRNLPPTDSAPQKLSTTPEQWNAYRKGLASIESSGGNYGLMGGAGGRYAGAYQFGPNEIRETARALGEITPSTQQFLINKQMQERYLAAYTDSHHQQLMQNQRYAAMSTEEKLKVLGYAHNQGAGGANKYLNTGVPGQDAFGTSGTKYSAAIQRELDSQHNNAPVPWLSNPRLLRAPRFNSTLSSSNNYATSETNVHSLIINGSARVPTDDAYGISADAVPSLERNTEMNQVTGGPH